MNYTDIIMTLVFATMLWIVIFLAIIAKAIHSVLSLFRFKSIERKIQKFDRDHTPKVIKMMAVRVVGGMTIRYILKKVK